MVYPELSNNDPYLRTASPAQFEHVLGEVDELFDGSKAKFMHAVTSKLGDCQMEVTFTTPLKQLAGREVIDCPDPTESPDELFFGMGLPLMQLAFRHGADFATDTSRLEITLGSDDDETQSLTYAMKEVEIVDPFNDTVSSEGIDYNTLAWLEESRREADLASQGFRTVTVNQLSRLAQMVSTFMIGDIDNLPFVADLIDSFGQTDLEIPTEQLLQLGCPAADDQVEGFKNIFSDALEELGMRATFRKKLVFDEPVEFLNGWMAHNIEVIKSLKINPKTNGLIELPGTTIMTYVSLDADQKK